MTPKEKAKNLVRQYWDLGGMDIVKSKQCALIAVDEMIVQNGELYLNSLGHKTIQFYIEKNIYLFEVKQEINLL